MKRILLITNDSGMSEQITTLQIFVDELNRQGNLQYDFCTVQELVFAISNLRLSISRQGNELKDTYDIVHLRNVNKFGDYANALRLYCDKYGLTLVNKADAMLPYYGKVSQGFLLAMHGIITPEFISSPSNQTLTKALESHRTIYPVVIKHNDGVKGLDNYIAEDITAASLVLQDSKQGFVIQTFIANSGELRILRFGNGVAPLIFKKQAVAGTHLNNTSQGGTADLVAPNDVDGTALEQALQAAELMGRDIAGVDVLIGDDGINYVLEVNTTPSIATGAFTAEKQQAYITFMSLLEGERV